jgi:hypothetical protein
MAKASRPGNQAVAGIQAATTDQERFPDYYAGNNAGSGNTGTGKTTSSGSTKTSTSTKTTSSYSSKSSGGSGSSGSGANAGYGSIVDMLGYNPYALDAVSSFKATAGNGVTNPLTSLFGTQVEAEAPVSAWNPLIDSGNYQSFGMFSKERGATGNYYDRAMNALALELQGNPAPRYNNQKEHELDQALSALVNRERYAYRPEDDKFWGLYKDRYTQLGQRAMKDAMGQAAGLTGGYGTSYGQAVGQNAFNEYMADLMLQLPLMEERAYDRWMDYGDELARNFNLTNQNYKNYYERYRDDVEDYNDNRDRVRDYYEELFDEWSFGKEQALKQDQERNKVYSFWEDERQQNADRRLKADTTNANNVIAVDKANASAMQQNWENQLNLLKAQLQYAYA